VFAGEEVIESKPKPKPKKKQKNRLFQFSLFRPFEQSRISRMSSPKFEIDEEVFHQLLVLPEPKETRSISHWLLGYSFNEILKITNCCRCYHLDDSLEVLNLRILLPALGIRVLGLVCRNDKGASLKELQSLSKISGFSEAVNPSSPLLVMERDGEEKWNYFWQVNTFFPPFRRFFFN